MVLVTVAVAAVVLIAVARGGEGGDGGDGADVRKNTIQTIVDRGELKCGVKQTQPGFGFRQPDGSIVGFDVEFCKAIAAAVLGDASKV